MLVMDDARLLSLEKAVWAYRGEGNANLVISFPRERLIARMKKADSDMDNSSDKALLRHEDHLRRTLDFYSIIVVPLLGEAFVSVPFIARLPEEDLELLHNETRKARPTARLHKSVTFGTVTLHPDYALLPRVPEEFGGRTYCVEIKPKQGWVHPGDRTRPKCTFCLKQYLKLERKTVPRLSRYCPLDLFSGHEGRMKKALRSLLANPQNNLKMFSDGSLVYGEDTGTDPLIFLREMLRIGGRTEALVEEWCRLMIAALTATPCGPRDVSLFPEETPQDTPRRGFDPSDAFLEPCEWSTSRLPHNCVLGRILRMQKLQTVPFSDIYSMYTAMKCREDYAYLENILDLRLPLSPVHNYLLSAVAKDCSLFVSLRRVGCAHDLPDNVIVLDDCEGGRYAVSIGISDLDPKPLSCIGKHSTREVDVNSCLKKFKKQAK